MKFLFLVLFSLSAQAETLECVVSENFKAIYSGTVQPSKTEKTLIFRSESLAAYVSKKKLRTYEVEMFLPEYELRTYGLGSLSTSEDRVGTSAWGRSSLLDVTCNLKD